MPKNGSARLGPVSRTLAYLGNLAFLLGGTFFGVVTFLSFVAERDAEAAIERSPPPKLMRDSEKARPLRRLFETRIGPPVLHPGPPGGAFTPSQIAVAKAKADVRVRENRNAGRTQQPAEIFQGRGIPGPGETDLSIAHFFTR